MLPNPFDSEGLDISLRQWANLLYFKANHRKVLITGRRDGSWRLLIGSLNPADGSANHSNLGVLVEGAVAVGAVYSELEVAQWSLEGGFNLQNAPRVQFTVEQISGLLAAAKCEFASGIDSNIESNQTVAWRSEGAIREEIIGQINRAESGTNIDAAVFYFSDRRVVDSMKRAVKRGVKIRLLLDANRDAFGREKNGIPNRPVAAELMQAEGDGIIEVRWASTHGEQYHAKVLRVRSDQKNVLLLGSANWTRRNLNNLNLEANVVFENAEDLGVEFDVYFNLLWNNSSKIGFEETLSYEAWAETDWSLRWKTWLYRFQEWSGVSTF